MSASAIPGSAGTSHAHTYTVPSSGFPPNGHWQCQSCWAYVPNGQQHVCPKQWNGTTTIGTGTGPLTNFCTSCGMYYTAGTIHNCSTTPLWGSEQQRLQALEQQLASAIAMLNNLSIQLAELQRRLDRFGKHIVD